jgi:hypothetical protein
MSSVEPSGVESTPRDSLVFFRGPDIAVTGRSVVARGRRFDLDTIGNMSIRRQRAAPVVATTIGAVISLVFAVTVTIGGALAWTIFGVAAVIGVPAAAWAVVRRSESNELWIELRDGPPVLLFSSNDPPDFHKVVRAIQRARNTAGR